MQKIVLAVIRCSVTRFESHTDNTIADTNQVTWYAATYLNAKLLFISNILELISCILSNRLKNVKCCYLHKSFTFSRVCFVKGDVVLNDAKKIINKKGTILQPTSFHTSSQN